MKLYYAETLNPRKACAVAQYVGAPVEFVHVDLKSGEHRKPPFLAINPNGKVPVLEDGENRVWEANAIMGYLAQSAGSDFWPTGARQIDVLRWLSWDAQHFSRHASTLYFEHVIKPIFHLGPPDESCDEGSNGSGPAVRACPRRPFARSRISARRRADHCRLRGRRSTALCRTGTDPARGISGGQRWHDRLNGLAAWREPFPQAAAA